jgi:pyruvate dehydrogenase E2 component (dihydrolipoamide acetyltransferase)
MAEIITMPRMTDSMDQGVIVGWLKKVGDVIKNDDVLAEVETDKATMELPWYGDGTRILLHIGVEKGSVNVGEMIAVLGQAGEDFKAALAPKTEAVAAPQAAIVAVATPSTPALEVATRLKASPLAKNMAADAGVDITKISGTGEAGRIVRRDIEAALGSKTAVVTAAPVAVAPTPSPITVTKTTTIVTSAPISAPKPASLPPVVAPAAASGDVDTPLSSMRKTIARRLSESKFSAPHFYLTMEINMDKASEARERINALSPVRISFNDIILKACAIALQQHPVVNSSWMGDFIRQNANVNIGVAVAVEEGLLVPVIKNANAKSLSQIGTEVRLLAGKAKEKKLQPSEMQGNTFTISNLGMFDIDEFTAIINPPDACILAVGSILKKPIVKDDAIAIGSMMKVTLSCDHRVVDGASGAKFLQTIKSILEEPIRLMI